MPTKLLVALVAAIIAVLLAEGAWSLAFGDSLLFPRPLARSRMLDAERIAAAALTEGAFAVDEDPVVGFRVKGGITREFFGVEASTDGLGMRTRTGPAPAPGAASIVVLGDSYAFGFGVRDDETLAHHLEELLAETMPEGTPRPVVHTVGCPGWNFANQARYLANHFERLAPDVVVMVPVANDLDDAYAVSETGHVLALPGIVRPHCGVGHYAEFVAAISERKRVFVAGAHTWPLLLTDLSPESKQRWDGYVGGIAELAHRLAARGGRLVVAFPERDGFQVVLRERLRGALPELPLVGLPGPRGAEDCLDGDPHPNGRWYAAAARLVAERVIAGRWIEGAGARPLPAGDPNYAGRGMDLTEWRVEAAEAWAALFGAVFDFDATDGFWQVYGGIDAKDGTVGMHCMLGLRLAGATELVLTIERLPVASGIYPLRLTVTPLPVGEARVLPVPAPELGDRTVTLSVPIDAGVGEAIDFLIAADDRILDVHEGASRLASFRLLRAELRRP